MRKKLFTNLGLTDELVNSVKKIFGIEFVGLKNYFKREFFLFNKNKATILITRRCALLAVFFLNYLLNYEIPQGRYSICEDMEEFPYIEKNGMRNYLFTDKTDISNIVSLSINEIVIVDDICIHGNTLGNIADGFIEQLGDTECEVSTHVYMISKETILRCPDVYSKIACRAAWSALSQRIVNAINRLNTPYVSYINTWSKNVSETDFKKVLNAIRRSKSLLCEEYDIEQNVPKQCDFIAEKETLLFLKERMMCFRLYYSSETQTMTFVPFVILFQYDSNIEPYFEGNHVLESVQLGGSDKVSFLASPDKKDYLYNLFSCSESYFYGLYFIKKYLNIEKEKLDKEFIQDITGCIWMTFGKGLLNFFAKFDWNFDEYCVKEHFLNRQLCSSELNDFSDGPIDIRHKVENFVLNTCRDSWLDLEMDSYSNFSSNRNGNKGFLFIKDVISDLLDWFDDKENQPVQSKYQRALIVYFAFLILIKLCDMGRMNIGTNHNTGMGMLKAGELGYVLAKRPSYDDNFAGNMLSFIDAKNHSKARNNDVDKVTILRREPYYRCLL